MMAVKRPPAVWIGNRGLDAECLEGLVELRGIACCDWSDELAELSRAIPVASLERDTRERLPWLNSDLERFRPGTLRALFEAATRGCDAEALAACYSPQSVIETALPGPTAAVLAASSCKPARRLGDKTFQRELFRALGLRVPEWAALSATELRSGAFARPCTLPAVAQPVRGTRGIDVYRFERWEEAARIAERWPAEEPLLVSRWIDGVSVNVNAVVGRENVCVAWPSVQILAPPGCCDAGWPFAYCGNDYAAAEDLPVRAHDLLCAALERLGPALRREGFLGLYGLDLVWDGSAWWLLELNPRFQGSTALLARLEREAGVAPLVAAHLEVFAPGCLPAAALPPPRPTRALRGAHVLLYQAEAAPVILRAAPASGVLAAAPQFTWREAPVAGTRVHPRAPLGRLSTAERVLDGSLCALEPRALAAVEVTRARLVLEATREQSLRR
jgi:predicted ATP-grasp superfamily ATP-dependent carboligase